MNGEKMYNGLTEQEFFSMAFNAGIASITQVMQKYKGLDLEIIGSVGHKISLQELSKILQQPEEDVALFLQPYVEPVQEMIDKVAT